MRDYREAGGREWPQCFERAALNEVPVYRPRYRLRSHDDGYPGLLGQGRGHDKRKMRGIKPFSGFLRGKAGSGKAEPAFQHTQEGLLAAPDPGAVAELYAAFLAPASEHALAGSGLRAGAEAVRLRTLALLRLVGSLGGHGVVLRVASYTQDTNRWRKSAQ
jgi:hypothetical protein